MAKLPLTTDCPQGYKRLHTRLFCFVCNLLFVSFCLFSVSLFAGKKRDL